MEPLYLNGDNLSVASLVEAAQGRQVALAPEVAPRLARSRQVVEDIVSQGQVAYGINTGFGR